MLRKSALAVVLALAAAPAGAYIGPGAGISFVGSLFTWLVGIIIAIFAVLFWPIRVLFRRFRPKRDRQQATPEADRPGQAGDEGDTQR